MNKLLGPKKAMDAVNEALLKETEYPAADKDYNPGYFKGTEPEQIKHGKQGAEASEYLLLAEKIVADLRRLAAIAPEGGDIHAMASMDAFDLQHFIREARGTAHVPQWIEQGSNKQAEVAVHETPRHLPPRNELRRHVDEDVKKEIELDKEGSVRLTAAQRSFKRRAFERYQKQGKTASRARAMAAVETRRRWPELAGR